VAAGSGETRRRLTGRRWGRGALFHGQGTAPYMGAAASSCMPAAAEAGATSQTSTGARDRGRAGDGPADKGGRGRRRTRRIHAAVRTPEGGLGARNAWGRSGPRLARGLEAEARAAQVWRTMSCRGAARRRAAEPFHSALVQTRLTLKF
jgi:hypothetical protein